MQAKDMSINIEKATEKDMPGTMELIRETTRRLMQDGNNQWGDDYPTADIFEDDVRKGFLFVARVEGEIAGIISLSDEIEDEHRHIKWLSGNCKALYPHRLAVRPKSQGKGVARALMDYSEKYGRDKGFGVIRFDVYSVNTQAIQIYEDRGCKRCEGEVYYPGREHAFYCYEKKL